MRTWNRNERRKKIHLNTIEHRARKLKETKNRIKYIEARNHEKKRSPCLKNRHDRAGQITDGIIQGGFFFLILASPLMFGSVYTWATSILQWVTAIMFGAWLIRHYIAGSPSATGIPNRKIFLPVFLFLILVLFQLVSLPPKVLKTLSPKTSTLYELYLSDLDPSPQENTDEPAKGEMPGKDEGTLDKRDRFSLSINRLPTRTGLLRWMTYFMLLYLLLNYRPQGSLRRFLLRFWSYEGQAATSPLRQAQGK